MSIEYDIDFEKQEVRVTQDNSDDKFETITYNEFVKGVLAFLFEQDKQ